MSKKFVLILLDGLGDKSFARLGHQTPLQAAHTPFLDSLAQKGCTGLYHAASQGQALPSENAHFVMFGYDLREFPGRGALEALGSGIELQKDQVAVLAHFAYVGPEQNRLRLLRDHVQAEPWEIQQAFFQVAEFQDLGLHLSLRQAKGPFGVILLKGGASPHITDSNPVLDGNLLTAVKPLQGHEQDPASINTAQFLTRYLSWAHARLSKTELNQERKRSGAPLLNALVTQRAGRLRERLLFAQKNGIKGLSVASGVVYQGLARYLGMGVVRAEEMQDPGLELRERIHVAGDYLDKYDFIHVHSKAPDEAAHKKDPLLKKQAIESLDRGLSQSLPSLLDRGDVTLAVTADHSTPSGGYLVHSGEPVPLLITGPGTRVDPVEKFHETSVACGGLGFVRGRELMYLVLNYLERAKLMGLRDTPEDRPYWPGGGEPFILEPDE